MAEPADSGEAPPCDEAFLAAVNRLRARALTQHSTQEFLRDTLVEAVRATGGHRAFLAGVVQETGELIVMESTGPDWSDDIQRFRLQPHNETHRGITGYVAITGEPYLSADVANDPHYLAFFDDVRSEAAVPLFDSEGRVRGVLNVDSCETNHFQEGDITRLVALANGIETALTFDEFRGRERLLVQVARDLAELREIEPLVQRVVALAAEALRCEACSLFLIDETGETLVLQATTGTLSTQVGKATYPLGEGLTGTVALTGESIRLDDPRTDPRWRGRYPEFSREERSAYLAVPIPGRERVLGVIRASRPRSAPAWFHARFTRSDERLLKTIASQLGIAVENVRSFSRLVRSERMAAWGELSAKSAHMIGNRTFAIKGDLNELKYLLARCVGLPASEGGVWREINGVVASIEQGVFRLEEILREFRDFVMATQLTLKDVEVNHLVREVVEETFPRRGPVALEQSYTEHPPLLRADSEKLKRAFAELVENSVSFMPDGGVLRVSTALIETRQVPPFVRLTPTRRYVEITFADTGPGVVEEIKKRIFTPFFTSRVKGMGLGLSIVRGIVEAHHGRIYEAGDAGSGARFLIYLPIAEEHRDES